MRRIAVFGGTFDPIHHGHLHVVKAVLEQAPFLDALWLMPNVVPPHRLPPLLEAETRFALCSASVADLPKVEVKRIEFELPYPSYTVNTLRYLRNQWPDVAFLWIVGMDAFHGLPKWHEWPTFFTMVDWLVIERPGYESVLSGESGFLLAWKYRHDLSEVVFGKHFGGNIYTVVLEPHLASSTQIRKAYSEGQLDRVRAWLPESVWKKLSGEQC